MLARREVDDSHGSGGVPRGLLFWCVFATAGRCDSDSTCSRGTHHKRKTEREDVSSGESDSHLGSPRPTFVPRTSSPRGRFKLIVIRDPPWAACPAPGGPPLRAHHTPRSLTERKTLKSGSLRCRFQPADGPSTSPQAIPATAGYLPKSSPARAPTTWRRRSAASGRATIPSPRGRRVRLLSGGRSPSPCGSWRG